MEDIYHVEIRRDREGIWATVQGPGLPRNGDTRASADMWEVAQDITLAIQEANPAFTAPFRMIPFAKRRAPRWQFWRRHQHQAIGEAV